MSVSDQNKGFRRQDAVQLLIIAVKTSADNYPEYLRDIMISGGLKALHTIGVTEQEMAQAALEAYPPETRHNVPTGALSHVEQLAKGDK